MTKGIAIKHSRVRVAYGLYQSERGEMPRGDGRWMFRAVGSETRFICSGLYSKAKRSAMRKAASRGVYDIEVMP